MFTLLIKDGKITMFLVLCRLKWFLIRKVSRISKDFCQSKKCLQKSLLSPYPFLLLIKPTQPSLWFTVVKSWTKTPIKRATRIFQGRKGFVELRHFNKHFFKNTREKGSREKKLKFFLLDTLKTPLLKVH